MLALCLLAVALHGQQAAPAAEDSAAGRIPPQSSASDTRLVVCHTTVVDKNGHLVTDLPREHFTVFENGVQQKITVSSARTCRFRWD